MGEERAAADELIELDPASPPRSRSRERITRQQRELQDLREQNRRLTEALMRHQPAPQPDDPSRQVRLDDLLDQEKFRRLMRERRLPAKYHEQVEALLLLARQRGENPLRETVLKTLIGGEHLERKDREAERQRQRGQRRIQNRTQQVAS